MSRYISQSCYFNLKIDDGWSVADIIYEIYLILKSNELVDEEFYNLVIQRENMASTSFPSGVATPHTMKLSDSTSKLVVFRLDREFNWSGNRIKFILIPIISKRDISTFNDFFQNIIQIFSEKINVSILSRASSYSSFVNKMLEIYLNDF